MDILIRRYTPLVETARYLVDRRIHDHYVPGVLGGVVGHEFDVYRLEGRHLPMEMRLQTPYYASGDPETDEYTALPATGSTLPPAGMLGAISQYNRAGLTGPPQIMTYQFVKQAAAITGVVGNVYWWSDKVNFVATTSRTNRGLLAGICRIAAANAASYIWLLKHGRRTVKFQAVPSSAPDTTGKPVVPSMTTDGTADCLTNDEAQPGFPLIGVALSVTASNLATCDVNIPDGY